MRFHICRCHSDTLEVVLVMPALKRSPLRALAAVCAQHAHWVDVPLITRVLTHTRTHTLIMRRSTTARATLAT
jgi:hypothetical protein